MKDIKRIKCEYAYEHGFEGWADLQDYYIYWDNEKLENAMYQVAIRYANEQKRELIEVLKECLDWEYMSVYNEDLYTRIEELIAKHKQTERSSE